MRTIQEKGVDYEEEDGIGVLGLGEGGDYSLLRAANLDGLEIRGPILDELAVKGVGVVAANSDLEEEIHRESISACR